MQNSTSYPKSQVIILQIGVLQIAKHEMAKECNLKYLTKVLGQNG